MVNYYCCQSQSLVLQYFETYSPMSAQEEQYIPPTAQEYQHRVLVYHANGLVGHRLVEYFRNDHLIEVNPNIIMGTINCSEKYANDLGLTIEIDSDNLPLLNAAISQSDIILYPLSRSNTLQLEHLLKYLKCLQTQKAKKLIVISSVFQWKNRGNNPVFKKEDYLQRISIAGIFEELEHFALGIGNYNANIKSCVVNSGLVYGMGEDNLFFSFKQALEQKHPLVVYGSGKNIIPMIHVDDLAQFVHQLSFSEQAGFYYAADYSKITQAEIITTISQTIGNGKVEYLPIESAFLHQHYDILTADIRIDAKSLPSLTKWRFIDGFTKNIGSIVGEFNASRGLKPNKILIYGTPASGKSKLAEMLAKNYGLPVLQVKQLIDQIKSEDSPFANEIKAVLQQLRAVKIEQQRKIHEDAKKKKKGKGVQQFDPSKVTVRLPEQEVCKILKRRINMADCLNKGYIIDSVLKSYSHFEAVFLNEKGEISEATLPNSVFNVEGAEQETKQRVKKLPIEATQGTHLNEAETLRRFGVYHKQNQGKKWHTFFAGKVDIKQVPFGFADPTQFIEFIERNGPLGFKVKPKKEVPQVAAVKNEQKQEERRDNSQDEQQQQNPYEQFNLQKLTQNQIKILNQKSRPIRQYLIDNVIPQITEGLLQICKESPPDPIKFLITFLQNKRNKKRPFKK